MNTIVAALAAAQANVAHANQVAAGAAGVAASQHAMIIEAKQRIDDLSAQLRAALAELQETEAAAHKAIAAAQIAQANVAAATKAVVDGAEVNEYVNRYSGGYGGHVNGFVKGSSY